MPRLLVNGWFWGQTATGSGQYLHGLLRHLPAALPDWQITLLLPGISGQWSVFSDQNSVGGWR